MFFRILFIFSISATGKVFHLLSHIIDTRKSHPGLCADNAVIKVQRGDMKQGKGG